MMKMKTGWKVGGIIGLAVIIAMAAIGISYACYDNPPDQSLCKFSWVEPNDNGSTSNHGVYNPVDPGDDGSDPSGAQAFGVLCPKVPEGKKVASTTATYTDDTITFNVTNVYPGYHPTLFFGIKNQNHTPGVVSSITYTNPNPSLITMTLNGITLNQVIGAGEEVIGALNINFFSNSLQQGQSYTLTVTIVVTQYTHQGQNKTKTSLMSIPNPSDHGQTVYFGAVVTSVGHKGIPTGTVEFMEGTTVLGTGNLFFGLTSFSTSSLSVGSHNITAVYLGDNNFAGSTSKVVVQKVRYDTATTLTSSLNPSTFGQTVKFTAKVKVQSPGTGTPSGHVTFYDGPNSIGTGSLSGGTAVLNYSSLPAGAHAITAVYDGDSKYGNSTSNTVTQSVNKANTTTALSSAANPSVFGQSVKFTASVTPSAASGTVTFKDGSIILNTVSLSGGSASLSVSTLAVGPHSITAVYNGDPNGNDSTSNTVTQTVNKASTKTALSTSDSPIKAGKSVTFTAIVTAATPGTGTPGGTVDFYDGATKLGTGTLSGGNATFSTSSLSKKTHSIKAVYNGDGNFSTSTSNTISQKIN